MTVNLSRLYCRGSRTHQPKESKRRSGREESLRDLPANSAVPPPVGISHSTQMPDLERLFADGVLIRPSDRSANLVHLVEAIYTLCGVPDLSLAPPARQLM